MGFLFLFLVSCERIRTEHLVSSSYLRAEVVAGGTMSFSSSSEGIGEGFGSEAWMWWWWWWAVSGVWSRRRLL